MLSTLAPWSTRHPSTFPHKALARVIDVLCMGRSSIDLYAHEIGVPITGVRSFDAYVGGCADQRQRRHAAARAAQRAAHRRRDRPGRRLRARLPDSAKASRRQLHPAISPIAAPAR